jgi:hypothetical protein
MKDGGAVGKHGPEDEIDRRLRELADEVAGAPRIREPSALERAAAAKREAKANKRAAKANKRSRGLIAASAILLAVLAVSGGLTWYHFSHSSASPRVNTKRATPKVSVTTGAPLVNSGPPADPFAGTPADRWADGAAGIVVPAAMPEGAFTAAQVKAAYQTTRKVLIAGNLDWPTLRGGAPAAFASLLSLRQYREFVGGLNKTGLDKQGFPLNTRGWVASFAPAATKFVTTVIKVHGSMSAGTATVSGSTVLRVHVNYRFVYAVEPPGNPADWMRIVNQQYGYVDFAHWDSPGGPLEPWVETTPSPAGGQCGTGDGYIHPAYPHGAPSKVQPSGPPVDPYSMATPASSNSYVCQRASGT